jgi:lipoate---protein ligase
VPADNGWVVERHRGSARAFHERVVPEPVARAVWLHDVTRPAIVLGSAQDAGVVDADAATAAGVEVVRRRSGGGAVLLMPGEVLWVDVVLPAGDPLWLDDVSRAMWWIGEAWSAVLGPLASVHRGPLVTSAWSRLVCFAGLGAGEVTIGDAKAVGVSQRRTRSWARFQCAAYTRWRPSALAALLALDGDERARLGEALTGAVVTVDNRAAERFVAALAADWS